MKMDAKRGLTTRRKGAKHESKRAFQKTDRVTRLAFLLKQPNRHRPPK